jgi:hypothetical protein
VIRQKGIFIALRVFRGGHDALNNTKKQQQQQQQTIQV